MHPIDGLAPLTPEDTERAVPRCSANRPSCRSSARTARSTSPTRSRPGPLPLQRLPPARLGLARHPRHPGVDQDDRRALAPARHPRAGRGGARDRAAHRDHRLGQVDDARRDDRPHQLDPPAPHRDRRGPDRVPPRGQEVDHQPARGRAWTPARSSARCAASCARTPTSSSSARCATRRRSTPR